MIETRVLKQFPGGVELFHYDHATDEITYERRYDSEPVIEQNVIDRGQLKSNWRGDLHLVARIPLTLYFDLKKQGILDDDKAFSRWMNDRDNKVFRVKEGRV